MDLPFAGRRSLEAGSYGHTGGVTVTVGDMSSPHLQWWSDAKLGMFIHWAAELELDGEPESYPRWL